MVSASPVRLSMKSCGRMATDSRKMEKDHKISVTELFFQLKGVRESCQLS